MANLLDLAMLVCASLGALAFGILAAFGVLRGCFALMRPQPRHAAAVDAQPQATRIA